MHCDTPHTYYPQMPHIRKPHGTRTYHTQIHISHYSHPHAMHARCTRHTTHITYGHIKHIIQCTIYVPHTSLPSVSPFPLPSQHAPAYESIWAFSHFCRMNSKLFGWPYRARTLFVFTFCTLELGYGTLTAPCLTRTVGQMLSSALPLCLLIEVFSV